MLGFIPDFQFSADPHVNPYVNPWASMPKGLYQAGVYSSQPAYSQWAPNIVQPDPLASSITSVRVPPGVGGVGSALGGALGYVMAWPNAQIANLPYGVTKSAQLAGAGLMGLTDWVWSNKLATALGLTAAYFTWKHLDQKHASGRGRRLIKKARRAKR